MTADVFLRRTHRVIAVLFLLSVPPAGYFSITATGEDVSPVVYFPLVPLLGLMLTGSYLLVRPWVQRLRARRSREVTSFDVIHWSPARDESIAVCECDVHEE